MAFGNGYIVGFAAAVCVVCSLGVAGASMGLRPLQQVNEERAFQGKVLTALGLPDDGSDPQGEEVNALYAERVKLIVVDESGQPVDKTYDDVVAARAAAKGTGERPGLYPVYQRMDGDEAVAYALEMQGKGLWGPIYGFLAVSPDAGTVQGVTFDAPKETPGLGAEIMKPAYQKMWEGKKLHNGAEFVPIDVTKGSAALACPDRTEFCVDGISGATITSRGVDAMIEDTVDNYRPYLQQIRSGS